MRILICEDHPMCREGIVMACSKAAPDAEIERAGSLAEADQYLNIRRHFDLIITDLMLPDAMGFESLLHFRQRSPASRIAVATGSTEAGAIAHARALGAIGFVSKGAAMSEMLASIGRLVAGEEVFPVGDFPDQDDLAVHVLELTPSQLRMVMAAARGQLNKQIAFENGVSEATVKSHLAAAFKKLGVTNRTQAGLLINSLTPR